MKKYPRKGNIFLDAPEDNPVMLLSMGESAVKRDNHFQNSQHLAGSALSALGQGKNCDVAVFTSQIILKNSVILVTLIKNKIHLNLWPTPRLQNIPQPIPSDMRRIFFFIGIYPTFCYLFLLYVYFDVC